MAEIRTAVVKGLSELFWYIIAPSAKTIVGARSIAQIGDVTDTTAVTVTALAARGAGHSGAGKNAYAVALNSIIDSALSVGKDSAAKTAAFAANDPPYTAIPFSASITEDLNVAATVTAGTSGQRFAIVEQPPTYTGGLISFVTASNIEMVKDMRRGIREKGVLQHRKMNAWPHAGVLNFTALYENAKRGLGAFVDRDIIIIGEREDDRGLVVTEKVIFYGGYIPQIPTPTEQDGDADSEITIPVQFELMAIVGETV